ncbi:MAG: hypothetical protein IPK84_00250 [Candidatus Moraniibacteriota bacterium]|nr:MAG: hypothetical protein IPK84_00250 [Candidatus Moranbacteria bacterium]
MVDIHEKKQTTSSPLLLSESDASIVERISGAWIAFLFGAFLLAIGGKFTDNTILFLSLAVVTGALIALRKLRPSKKFALVSVAIFFFIFSTSFSPSPSASVFSGRDQGSYAEAAIRLAHEHSLHSYTPSVERNFFRLYGTGKALNFPGFFFAPDGSLVTQFPLGNIAWFGANISLFGIAGLSIANAFTLFISLLVLFTLLWRFLPFQFAVGGVAIAALSFPFIWIQEQTLSENLALPLFLILSFCAVLFLNQPRRWTYLLALSSSVFLCLTRIEGFAILVAVATLFLSRGSSRKYILTHWPTTILFALVVTGAVIGVDIFFNTPFYKTIGKAATESSANTSQVIPSFISSALHSIVHVSSVFWTYGIISVTSLSLLGIVFLFKKREHLKLVPFWLALPTFAYIFSPQISSDHPWMLRRFVFAFWPTVVILAIFALAQLQRYFKNRYPEKIIFRPTIFSALFSTLLILPAIPATAPRLFFAENRNLLADVETLSNNFSDHDLVLVDRMSSGDPFSIIADPMSTLFGKNAVYFFNPSDLSNIDTDQFEHIYLIARDGDEIAYQTAFKHRFELQKIHPYTLRTSLFSRETDSSRLSVRNDAIVSGSIFLVVPK